MTKPVLLTVNLPFSGFYESLYSGAIDQEEEQYCEWRTTESDESNSENESNWPESLQLSAYDLQELLLRHTDYSSAYQQIARDYVEAFDSVAGEALNLDAPAIRNRYNWETKETTKEQYRRPSIRATFESMDSPREYNFTTDRVYAQIPLAVMRDLFKRSKAESHVTLAAVLKERFTSRDGFLSHYSNRLAEWLDKPLQEWDHNELGTLLIAALRAADFDPDESDSRWQLYESTFGDEGAYQAWDSAVDWPAFEGARLEKRAEKLAEWIEEESESAIAWRNSKPAEFAALVAADESLFRGFELPELPYRCSSTVDLFTGQVG